MEIGNSVFFSFLRIRNQLGYLVKSRVENIQNQLFLLISVQGSKKVLEVNQLIDESLLKVAEEIKLKYRNNEKAFNSIKRRFLRRVSRNNPDLSKASLISWGKVLGEDDFITTEDFKDFSVLELVDFIENFLVKNKISIQVLSKSQSELSEKKRELLAKPDLLGDHGGGSVRVRDENYFRVFEVDNFKSSSETPYESHFRKEGVGEEATPNKKRLVNLDFVVER
jgi:secreted Zn-dependent insulinase-like peptidase